MPKRSRVPSALHSELSEYSSLLRALRTSNALDITTQLAKEPPELEVGYEDDELDYSDNHEDKDRVDVQELQTLPDLIPGPTYHGRDLRTKGKKRSADTWTRWPLLAGDVHVPEWGLEDEIQHIASGALRAYRRSDLAIPSEQCVNDEDLPTAFLHALSSVSTHYLSQILTQVALHVPLVEKSLQNRLRPMGWQDIINIVASSEHVNPDIIHRVRVRLAAMYGTSEDRATDRTEAVHALKCKLDDLYTLHDDTLFSFHPPPSTRPKARRRRAQKARKTRSAVIEKGGQSQTH